MACGLHVGLIGAGMALDLANPNEQVVIGEEVNRVRLITLNRPRQLNVISSKVVSLLAEYLEKWEKEDNAELVALVHGISMGGGASLMVPMKFSVVTEKTVGAVFATPEAGIGFHTDCSFSYILSHLPGHLGEYIGLTGARLNGKELVAAGLATHFVPSEKLPELEKRLINLNSGDEHAVKSVIEEFFVHVEPDEESILHKQAVIDMCFSKDSVEEIIEALEAEVANSGDGWIAPVLKGLKRSSPTGLKITFRSIREGRKQTLAECLKKEFRLTMNILRTTISPDVYEGIRALTIDKDNHPKWEPAKLDEVSDDKLGLVFQPFKDELELQIPTNEASRWEGKYESSPYPLLQENQRK
ncbi:hypothetical protein Sjap_000759 [Stephania japonica]|uniref:3-hydroxyisobutyryl-CoA hydrolase n=1 Tax=Stephania japonica TaxID=461633 RepID=A0AAP0PSV0_9MAGN